MNYAFNDETITKALEANGYESLWHPNNWVNKGAKDPDHAGMSKEQAFERLLKEKNLL